MAQNPPAGPICEPGLADGPLSGFGSYFESNPGGERVNPGGQSSWTCTVTSFTATPQ